MNFLITNMTGFRNKGCEAMTKMIIVELVKRFPNAKFAIFSNDPNYDRLWAPTEPEITFWTTPNTSLNLAVRLYRLFRKIVTKERNSVIELRERFAWSDAIISTGGDIFSSEYKGIKRHVFPIKYATRLGKPVFLLAHSIGPFKTGKERDIFIQSMQNVSLITVRESLSLEYVREINLKNVYIELSADPAFCLPAANSETVDKLWRVYHLPWDRPIVAIAASQGIAYYAKVSYESHFKALKGLIRHLTQQMGFHVILIPHVHEKNASNDDYLICNQLYRDLGFPLDVSIISLDHSAEEIKGLIGRCNLLIAERMHATIAGLSQLVPTLVVGYSIKAKGILRDIFGEDNINEYLIDIDKVNETLLKQKAQHLLENQKEVSAILRKRMPDIIIRTEKNFDLVEKILT